MYILQITTTIKCKINKINTQTTYTKCIQNKIDQQLNMNFTILNKIKCIFSTSPPNSFPDGYHNITDGVNESAGKQIKHYKT